MTEVSTAGKEHPGPPPGRIDPALSACVLIGVDDYTTLDELRSVRHNLTALQDALTSADIWGIAQERLFVVPNPATPYELVEPIRKAALLAKDTLLVYYAGHGLLDRDDNDLHLTLPGSVEDYPDTCVAVKHVRRAISDTGTPQRRVLVLDCCYSGQAIAGMSAADRGLRGRSAAVQTLRDVNGSYTMASSPRDRPSHAPYPDRCTVFTGALVDVLREGVADGPDMLGLHAICEEVKARVAALRPAVPQTPQDQDNNGVGRLEFVRNRAVLPPLAQPPLQAPPRHTARWALAAGAAGVTLGLLAHPALSWWQDAHPRPAAGMCDPGAELLDHSDALNKKQVDNEPIGGLSAISFVPGDETRALAVADNDPGRVFPIALGSLTDLDPRPSTAITLRRADGSAFANSWYDAESMVIEKQTPGTGRPTMLIGSETGPAIRRFDVATGRQVGPDFPIPKELTYWPDGGAQQGRSIESLTASPDGHYLYAGWEAPLSQDGDNRGQNVLRIQRYAGSPGGAYKPAGQYAYRSGDGLNLADLVAVDDDHLLALERQYVGGLGNEVQVAELSLAGAHDVTGQTSLYNLPADTYVRRALLFDLADCPAGGRGRVMRSEPDQRNPLLDNVEGMALGPAWRDGPHKGWRPLLMVSDDNNSANQITRLYSLAVKL
jgi:hypothetical protein